MEHRVRRLQEVFRAFDLDGNGLLGKKELFVIGTARRSMGQRAAPWTEENNERMFGHITANRKGTGHPQGQITMDEFVEHFDVILPGKRSDFEASVSMMWKKRKSFSVPSRPDVAM